MQKHVGSGGFRGGGGGGGGGGLGVRTPPLQLWNLKKIINSYCRLDLTIQFFLPKNATCSSHERKLKKSRFVPGGNALQLFADVS